MDGRILHPLPQNERVVAEPRITPTQEIAADDVGLAGLPEAGGSLQDRIQSIDRHLKDQDADELAAFVQNGGRDEARRCAMAGLVGLKVKEVLAGTCWIGLRGPKRVA